MNDRTNPFDTSETKAQLQAWQVRRGRTAIAFRALLCRADTALLLLSLVVFAFHFPTLNHFLLWDDLYFIDSILGADSFLVFAEKTIFQQTAVYRPIPSLMYFWPIQFIGERIWVYQLLPLLGHLLISWLVFLNARRVTICGSLLPVCTAILFSLNTNYCTESIWFTGFFEGQTGYIFGLLSLLLSLAEVQTGGRIIAAITALTLGLLSYEPVVIVVGLIVVGLIERQRSKGLKFRLIIGSLLLYISTAALYILLKLYLFPSSYGIKENWGVGWHIADNAWSHFTHLIFPRNIFFSPNPYLSNLDFILNSPVEHSYLKPIIIGLTLFLLLAIIITPNRWNRFFTLWVVLALLPFIFVKGSSDTRWSYFASAGVLALFCGSVSHLSTTLFHRFKYLSIIFLPTVFLVVAIAFGIGAYRVTKWFGTVGQRESRRQIEQALHSPTLVTARVLLFINTDIPERFLRQIVRSQKVERGSNPWQIVEGNSNQVIPRGILNPDTFIFIPVTADRPPVFIPLSSDVISYDDEGSCVSDPKLNYRVCHREETQALMP